MIPREKLAALCAEIDGLCGLYVSVPGEKERFLMNENAFCYAASTIKVPLLCLLFRDAEEGRLDLSAKVRIRPENRCGGAGILQSLDPNIELTLFDLAVLMIVMSDNIATNELIDTVGMERLSAYCKENGLPNTWLWSKMMNPNPVNPPHLPKELPINAICAGDLGGLLERMATGEIVSKEACGKMLRIMAGQRLGRFKTLLPCVKRENPYDDRSLLPPPGKVLAATKGGTKAEIGCIHDSGIFILPDGRYYVMAAVTQSSDTAKAEEVLRQMGLVMYEAMK